jgi:hypothetical protein
MDPTLPANPRMRNQLFVRLLSMNQARRQVKPKPMSPPPPSLRPQHGGKLLTSESSARGLRFDTRAGASVSAEHLAMRAIDQRRLSDALQLGDYVIRMWPENPYAHLRRANVLILRRSERT